MPAPQHPVVTTPPLAPPRPRVQQHKVSPEGLTPRNGASPGWAAGFTPSPNPNLPLAQPPRSTHRQVPHKCLGHPGQRHSRQGDAQLVQVRGHLRVQGLAFGRRQGGRGRGGARGLAVGGQGAGLAAGACLGSWGGGLGGLGGKMGGPAWACVAAGATAGQHPSLRPVRPSHCTHLQQLLVRAQEHGERGGRKAHKRKRVQLAPEPAWQQGTAGGTACCVDGIDCVGCVHFTATRDLDKDTSAPCAPSRGRACVPMPPHATPDEHGEVAWLHRSRRRAAGWGAHVKQENSVRAHARARTCSTAPCAAGTQQQGRHA